MALSGAKYEMAQLGQFGSIFTDGTGAVAAPTDYIICAITFLSASTFTELTVEDSATTTMFATGDGAAHNEGSATADQGSGGLVIADDDSFPSGITIYGRYTGFTLGGSSSVIAYLAPKH
tara:strand:+ start:2269 stop:2628 length:360 start_codon:yes stop_codon:yes gene_type:complete